MMASSINTTTTAIKSPSPSPSPWPLCPFFLVSKSELPVSACPFPAPVSVMGSAEDEVDDVEDEEVADTLVVGLLLDVDALGTRSLDSVVLAVARAVLVTVLVG